MDCTLKFKRKKRKTRKVLNEIRTRLNNQADKDYTNRYDSDCTLQKVNKKRNFITTNRLTLGLFHKVVRSETITRPHLAKISKQTDLNMINVSDKTTFNKENDFIGDHKPVNNSNDSCDKIECDVLEKELSLSRSNSPVLNSSAMSQKTTSLFEEYERSEYNDTLIWPSQSSHQDTNFQMCKKYNENKPKLKIKHFTSFFSEDDMKKMENYLCNLYLKSFQHKPEEKVMEINCDNFYNEKRKKTITHGYSSEILFEDDPINYIKQRYAQYQVESEGALELPTVHTSADSHINILTVSNVCPPYTHDAPEYIYYPHRLNQ